MKGSLPLSWVVEAINLSFNYIDILLGRSDTWLGIGRENNI